MLDNFSCFTCLNELEQTSGFMSYNIEMFLVFSIGIFAHLNLFNFLFTLSIDFDSNEWMLAFHRNLIEFLIFLSDECFCNYLAHNLSIESASLVSLIFPSCQQTLLVFFQFPFNHNQLNCSVKQQMLLSCISWFSWHKFFSTTQTNNFKLVLSVRESTKTSKARKNVNWISGVFNFPFILFPSFQQSEWEMI